MFFAGPAHIEDLGRGLVLWLLINLLKFWRFLGIFNCLYLLSFKTFQVREAQFKILFKIELLHIKFDIITAMEYSIFPNFQTIPKHLLNKRK